MPAPNPETTVLNKVNQELKRYKNLPDEGMIMGVCAGLAYRLSLPTWIVRAVFALLILGAGAGLVAYLLVGWLAPDGQTPKDYGKRTGDA